MGQVVGHKMTRRGGGNKRDQRVELRHVWQIEIRMRDYKNTGSFHLSTFLYILMNKTS